MSNQPWSSEPPAFLDSQASHNKDLVNVARGGWITLVGKIFSNLSRFVFAFLIARLLGAEQYGMYQLALNAATLLVGFTILGMDGVLVRFVSIYLNRGEKDKVWGTILIGVGVPLLLGSLVSIALFLTSYPVAEVVFHDIRMAPLLQVVGLIIPCSIMSDTLIGAVRGFKNMEYPVIAKFIVQPIIRLVLIGIAVIFGLRVIHAVAIFFVGELVAALIIFYYLNKLFSLTRPISAARADVNEIAKFAIPDWLAGLMDTFRGNIQALLIGALGSFTGVGIFTVSDQLNTIGRDFYSSINTASKPYIAELHDRNEHDKLQRIYQTTNKWSLLVNIPFFLILVLYPVQILSIFGKTFENGALALMIMACANLVDVGTGVGGAMLNMTGYTKLKLFNNIVSLVVSLALNVMLIPYFGVVGAALSALVVMAVLNTLRIVQVYRLLKLFPYNITFLKPLLAAIITGFVSYFLNKLYPIDSYLIHLAVHVSVLFAIFAFSIFILGLDPEDQQMVNRILGKSFRFFQRNK